MKDFKVRLLKKKINVFSSAQKGWGAEYIQRKVDVFQFWDADKGWVDIPTEYETIDVYKDDTTVSNY